MTNTVDLQEVLNDRLTFWGREEADALLNLRRARLAKEVLEDFVAAAQERAKVAHAEGSERL